MSKHILVVEDEFTLRKTLTLNLELEGYRVTSTEDGLKAIKLIENGSYHLVLLDIMLPGMNGFDVCQTIRTTHPRLPVLMLTARQDAEDRIRGLSTGADDYLGKPFHLEELLLRVAALLRRSEMAAIPEEKNEKLIFGQNIVDFDTHTARTQKGLFNLTPKEIAIVQLLSSKPRHVVTRGQILKHVWGYEVLPSTRTVDNFMMQIRKYFEDDPKKPRFFQSVHGVGYRFDPG